MEEGNCNKCDGQWSCIPVIAVKEKERDMLLIIATLIATVTFQGGVNPPGGIWQDNDDGHSAGRAIYASHQIAFYVFLVSITFALSTSLLVIVCLTYKFPLVFEIRVATASMMVTYASAIFAVTPHESVRFRYVLIAGALPVIYRCVFHKNSKQVTEKLEPAERITDNSQG